MAISSSSSSSSPTSSSLGYRAEIDGMRAIAVLAVVLFHARLGLLGGGYAGVDVFFVISGFLISRLIAEEFARSGRFSLVNFYERRIRRLFPALGAMVGLTLLVGWFQLPPGELMALARSGFAALAFFSNLYFAKEAGYFQPMAESQPLLHTWSLGVEEQFYILAPFIIVGLLYLPYRFRQGLVGLLALVSLVLAVVGAINLREASFFWPHARAYELLIGVALGLRLVPLPTSEALRMRLAAAGLVLVAGALVFLPPGIFFPSFWALIPCLGTAMVIAATEGGAIPGLPGRVLSAAPMRFFGKISYSLYLWHWPILVYATLSSEAHLPLWVRVGLMVLAVGISWLSYRFIETPARHGVVKNRLALVFAPAFGVVVAGFAFDAINKANFGFVKRFGPELARALEQMNKPAHPEADCDKAGVCTFGITSGPIRYMLWGDSHAGMMIREFSHQAKLKGVRGVVAFGGGCPPFLTSDGQNIFDKRKCHVAAQEVLKVVSDNPGIRVIVAARWAFYAESSNFGEEERVRAVRSLVKGDKATNRAAFIKLMESTVEALQSRGADVRLIGPVPEFAQDVFLTASRRLMRGTDPQIIVETERFRSRQQAPLEALKAAEARGVKVFYPDTTLCADARCYGVMEGVPLYTDNNHLSPYGVSQLGPLIARTLE